MTDPAIRPPSLLAVPSYLVANVARVLHAQWLEELGRDGLRPWHFAMLAALSDFGPLAQYELADRLNIKRSNLVGYVDQLEERGFVRRDADPADRRRRLVGLTDRGRQALERLQQRAQRSQPDLLEVLTEDELAVLMELLARLLRAHDERRLNSGAECPRPSAGAP